MEMLRIISNNAPRFGSEKLELVRKFAVEREGHAKREQEKGANDGNAPHVLGRTSNVAFVHGESTCLTLIMPHGATSMVLDLVLPEVIRQNHVFPFSGRHLPISMSRFGAP
jgi:hypothetical protein